eukprot:TRINITY_DN252_c0_g2_i1.p1 TRINITY_DN252_c0_g2~~TRINITY_DN252_c0_g2_i1.p1  ORF type:complete len:490 (-),score=66.03 TRINITY_DN252_c0_g2_i1:773-2242(-)
MVLGNSSFLQYDKLREMRDQAEGPNNKKDALHTPTFQEEIAARLPSLAHPTPTALQHGTNTINQATIPPILRQGMFSNIDTNLGLELTPNALTAQLPPTAYAAMQNGITVPTTPLANGIINPASITLPSVLPTVLPPAFMTPTQAISQKEIAMNPFLLPPPSAAIPQPATQKIIPGTQPFFLNGNYGTALPTTLPAAAIYPRAATRSELPVNGVIDPTQLAAFNMQNYQTAASQLPSATTAGIPYTNPQALNSQMAHDANTHFQFMYNPFFNPILCNNFYQMDPRSFPAMQYPNGNGKAYAAAAFNGNGTSQPSSAAQIMVPPGAMIPTLAPSVANPTLIPTANGTYFAGNPADLNHVVYNQNVRNSLLNYGTINNSTTFANSNGMSAICKACELNPNHILTHLPSAQVGGLTTASGALMPTLVGKGVGLEAVNHTVPIGFPPINGFTNGLQLGAGLTINGLAGSTGRSAGLNGNGIKFNGNGAMTDEK